MLCSSCTRRPATRWLASTSSVIGELPLAALLQVPILFVSDTVTTHSMESALTQASGWTRDKISLEQLHAAENPVTFLNDLYVRISAEGKKDPAVKELARKWSKKLEDGDPEARGLWQFFRDVSLQEFKKVYDLLGA